MPAKGKARKLNKKQMQRATEITKRDIERARTSWKEDAPVRFRNLLDAKKQSIEEAQK